MITYLQTIHFRRGWPTVIAVEKRRSVSHPKRWEYWLAVFNGLRKDIGGQYTGERSDYDSQQFDSIGKPLYDAFVAEAKNNQKKHKIKA